MRNDIVGITFRTIFFQLSNDKTLTTNQNRAFKMADDIAEKLIVEVGYKKNPPLFDKSNTLFNDTLKKDGYMESILGINGEKYSQ